MARIILILAICGFVGCASNGNVVSVRQIESDKPVVLRMRKDRTFIHSLLYPLSFEFKKTDKREIYYFESSYFAKHDELCPGTGECWLKSENQNDNLTYSYKKFYGGVLFTIENNDTIQTHLYKYYKKIIKENKDTIHVSLKEFNNHFKYIIDNFFEGDSIYLHFHDHKRWIDVPLRITFK